MRFKLVLDDRVENLPCSQGRMHHQSCTALQTYLDHRVGHAGINVSTTWDRLPEQYWLGMLPAR